MVDKVLFSSQKTEWETPQKFYDDLNNEFHFKLDAAADESNTKCDMWYAMDGLWGRGVDGVAVSLGVLDGLTGPWSKWTYCNPPYGRGETGKWVEKAANEAIYGNKSVLLLPARTDTRWFHKYIYDVHEIRFIKGRLKFGGATNSAPFPSMLVIFK